jgi:hypothetical protein
MFLGWSGETDGSFGGWSIETDTNPAFCVAIGPGGHPASFWYANATGGVSMGAAFYQGPDCTGAVSYAYLSDWPIDAAWRQVTGVLVAPAGTQSALFSLSDGPSHCDNYSGCSFSSNFDDLMVDDAVVSTPAISSITPPSGPVGTSINIVGVNFTGATTVMFNGTAAVFTVDSDTDIHATVPSGATTGPISVTTPKGTGTSNSAFGITPTIGSFSPTCGPAGASVDIRGSGFTGTTNVLFDGTDTSFVVDSDTEIHAPVPSGAMAGPIAVRTPVGGTLSSSPFSGPCY